MKILRFKLSAVAKIYQHSGSHLFLLLWKASHAVMRYDQKSISRQGFASLSDFAVLEVLLHKGSLPVNTIGQKVLLTSCSLAGQLPPRFSAWRKRAYSAASAA